MSELNPPVRATDDPELARAHGLDYWDEERQQYTTPPQNQDQGQDQEQDAEGDQEQDQEQREPGSPFGEQDTSQPQIPDRAQQVPDEPTPHLAPASTSLEQVPERDEKGRKRRG